MFLDVKLGSVNKFIVFAYSLFLIYIYSCDFAYQANSKRETLGVICVPFETLFEQFLFNVRSKRAIFRERGEVCFSQPSRQV